MYLRLILIALTVAIATPVFGQACGWQPHALIVQRLAEVYKETQVAYGVAASGALFEVYATRDGETWTLLRTTPQGFACIVASGEGWRVLEFKAPEQGS